MKVSFENELSFECNQGAIRRVVFNVDGEYCLTCGSNKTVKLWNPKKKLLLQTYSGHGFEVMDADCSCDSSQIVSGSLDKTVILWDVSSGQPLRRYRAHVGAVNCVCFNEDSSVFLSGSVDGNVKIWDSKSKSREPIQILDEAKDSISRIAVTDHEIATASLDGNVRRYDIRQGLMQADSLHAPVTCLQLANENCLLVSTLNSSLKFLDKSTGQILTEFKGHLNKKYRVECGLLANDSLVASGSEDGHIYLWSLLEDEVKAKLPHPHNVVHTISMHPSDLQLISGAENKLYLWNLTLD